MKTMAMWTFVCLTAVCLVAGGAYICVKVLPFPFSVITNSVFGYFVGVALVKCVIVPYYERRGC